MKKVKEITIFILAVVAVATSVFLIFQTLMPNKSKTTTTAEVKTSTKHSSSSSSTKKQQLTLVALGDSLTHGVGDTNNDEGYVGRIKTKLEAKDPVEVKTYNYGKTGDRSDQIKARVEKNTTLQENLAKADVITMTVGGNDLMKVLQQNFLSLADNKLSSAMPQAKENYATKLQQLLQTVRTYNQKAPIFLISVYNPFYVYFPTLTQIQKYTTEWNEVTKAVLNDERPTYFVNVEAKLSEGQYYGRSKETLLKSSTADLADLSDKQLEKVLTNDQEKNDYLSPADHFHPNAKGYDYMTQQLFKTMQKHKSTWLNGD